VLAVQFTIVNELVDVQYGEVLIFTQQRIRQSHCNLAQHLGSGSQHK